MSIVIHVGVDGCFMWRGGGRVLLSTLVIERKSDSGNIYYAQNQVLGALRCMYEAQAVAKQKIDNTLPTLPLGIVMSAMIRVTREMSQMTIEMMALA